MESRSGEKFCGAYEMQYNLASTAGFVIHKTKQRAKCLDNAAVSFARYHIILPYLLTFKKQSIFLKENSFFKF